MATLGEMTAGVAHEIKNPLNFVNNFAEGSIDLLDDLQETLQAHLPEIPDDDREDVTIVHDIIEKGHDGSISLQSDAAQTTEITIRLPEITR
jgi:signal transduction histidine kinase